jgi:hypothetical protein
MSVAACLWCETEVKSHTQICPECGLQNPAGVARGTSKVVRRGWRLLLAVLAVPLMLSAAYAAHVGALPPLVATNATAPEGVQLASTTPIPTPVFADPLQEAVWHDGLKAVRQALGQPGYAGFQGSFVSVAAGRIVSLCGEVAGTSGYDSATGEERFISVFGQAAATTLEGNDQSFGVLWNRVCTQGSGAV